ncbi:MAG: hypothetical protein Kow00127_10600 [Bacteroidales bacterium]
MRIVFFRTPKPKQFAYPPRYFDEEKERRNLRRKELGLEPVEGDDFGSRLQLHWKRYKKADRSRKKKAELSVLVYLIIVAMLIWFIFFS